MKTKAEAIARPEFGDMWELDRDRYLVLYGGDETGRLGFDFSIRYPSDKHYTGQGNREMKLDRFREWAEKAEYVGGRFEPKEIDTTGEKSTFIFHMGGGRYGW